MLHGRIIGNNSEVMSHDDFAFHFPDTRLC